MTATRKKLESVYVWDLFVRFFHWTLASSFFLNHFVFEGGERPHNVLGYLVLALLLARIVWGFKGPPNARFATFLRGPADIWQYIKSFFTGKSKRHLSHNPAGAWMMIILMILLAGAGVSGWMMTLDTFWGVDWVEDAHYLCSDSVLFLVWVHVAGALVASFSHRENLVLSMITGRKRA